ncbi:hypothetical protein D0962_16670 [Leptolyngbyaceae cyanobacterium CCMR0082]|uniref:Uncharacterized protein n=1 Tax=Adonisia turfae CCMR0082 TaxID=2304604 RepID=A0A6M0S8J5_9CYAN|nr:hypothetical protein [Adonisia turfae]NEZ64403.1 hypothetical protein [Adonisia turfae CCMR0082]
MHYTHKNTQQKVFLSLSIWATTVAITGYLGLFTHIPANGIALLVILSLTILVVLYYRNPALNTYINNLPPRQLVIFHLWRIVAGFAFLYYGSQNLLPERFVINAGYGDLAVGFLAPIILLGKESIQKDIAFHLFGQLDFILAVGTGLTFTVLQVPLMENIATFPIVLIPLFGVPLTGASSIMAIDALLRQRRQIASR